jgi:hypothetical protein
VTEVKGDEVKGDEEVRKRVTSINSGKRVREEKGDIHQFGEKGAGKRVTSVNS